MSTAVFCFTMLGADVMLAVVQTAILTHPTMAEGLNVLLAGVLPELTP